MGADIVERLEAIASREDQVFGAMSNGLEIREAAAEIVRLRGEACSCPSGDGSLRWPCKAHPPESIAPAEAKGPAPAMPNGVEGLSPAWHCTNCRNTFTATDALWKGHSDRCAPKCPNCKADSQYTYPEGVGGLIDKLEHYGFECQGGTLTNCSEWSELIRALRAADNRDAAGADGEGWPPCPECKAGILYECPACSSTNYPRDAIAPQPADGEAVALWISRHWREDLGRDSVVSVVNREDPAHTLRIYVSTTPPAPVQAAPQEGEAVAYLEIGPGGYLDLGTDRSDDSLLSMPPGKYMLGIIGHPSGDAVGAALRFLGELETVGNARAGDVARGLRKVAAHPSACELGEDTELLRWLIANELIVHQLKDNGRWMIVAGDMSPAIDGSEHDTPREAIRAALQHRGDSQEVGRG